MKKKELTSLSGLDVKDLKKQITDLKTKVSGMKVSRFTSQSKNVRETRNIRRQIAVMQTFVRQKELNHE